MNNQQAITDWEEFNEDISWFLDEDTSADQITALPSRYINPEDAEIFPHLARLISSAFIASIKIKTDSYELFSWTRKDGVRFGWLCLPPNRDPVAKLHPKHLILLKYFGGIVERYNEPNKSWLLNTNDSLTERLSLNHKHESYKTMLNGNVPLDTTQYYPISYEANGNHTLSHYSLDRILMFAQDHSFKHITPLDGCPKYTFYTINDVNNLDDWIESIAKQWQIEIA